MMQKRNIAMTTLSGHRHFWIAISVCLVVAVLNLPTAVGQTEEVAVSQKIAKLIDRLNSAAVDDRESAQAQLMKMPPDALDFIDVPNKNATTDFVQRLLAIRKRLETKAVQQTTQPSTVTLSGTFSTKEALAEIAAQTKNKISLSDRDSGATGKRLVTLDLNSTPFWSAINLVMRQSNLKVDLYGGTAGEIVLANKPQPAAPLAQEQKPPQDGSPPPTAPQNIVSIPQTTTGILSVAINRVDASRILNAPNLDYTTLNLLVRWEPRVSPISIRIDQSKLKIVDDQENTIRPLRQTPIAATVQTEIPELNFPINLPLLNRNVNQIKSIAGTLEAVLPGRMETFRFRKLSDLEPGATQTKSGATVTLGDVNVNEQLFGITVGLAFEGESNELDSHQGWTFDNEAFLVDPSNPHQRHPSVAYETVSQRGQSVVVEYYFEVDPAKYDLVYQTPAAIVSVSFDFKISEIPLP